MKYGNFAKHFQFEKGDQGVPCEEDAKWLTGGERERFAKGQFEKFKDKLEQLRTSQKQKLIDRGVIDG